MKASQREKERSKTKNDFRYNKQDLDKVKKRQRASKRHREQQVHEEVSSNLLEFAFVKFFGFL